MIKYIADCHVHSTYSEDATQSIDSIVAYAISIGLKYIAFTEHVDFNEKDNGYMYFDYTKYSKDIYLAREKYDNKITILKAIEFGEPHLYKKQFEIEQKRDYDFIIGSIHWHNNYFYGQKELANKYSNKRLMEIYYLDTLKMIAYGGFNVLGHLDFPNRYFKNTLINNQLIEPILEKLIEKDIVLEINTSGYRKEYNYTMPTKSTIVKYVEKGGSKITLGSDAHEYKFLTNNFNKVDNIKGINIGVFKDKKFVSI